MAKDEVEPTDWTLLFKHGKHTILLLADPLTPWTRLKTNLHIILKERYPGGLVTSSSPTPQLIPNQINNIALGVPVDVFDLSKGWTELDTTSGGLKECPKSIGLKDGSLVAFAFLKEDEEVGEPVFEVEFSSYEENYDMEEAAKAEEMDEDDIEVQ